MVTSERAVSLRERIRAAETASVKPNDATLDRDRYPDLTQARAAQAAEERARNVAQIKANAAVEAFMTHPGRDTDGALTVATRAGSVRLAALLAVDVGETTHLEVWLSGDVAGGDPHFRIYNPPTLVEDPNGTVELHGRRWREDPVAAVAEVVAHNGGRQKVRRP